MSIEISLGTAESIGHDSVMYSQSVASETLSSAATASTTMGTRGQVWYVSAKAAVYVEFGENPDGAGSTRWYLASGESRPFAVTANGEKVAFAAA